MRHLWPVKNSLRGGIRQYLCRQMEARVSLGRCKRGLVCESRHLGEWLRTLKSYSFAPEESLAMGNHY
jgi:hypothetical protein